MDARSLAHKDAVFFLVLSRGKLLGKRKIRGGWRSCTPTTHALDHCILLARKLFGAYSLVMYIFRSVHDNFAQLDEEEEKKTMTKFFSTQSFLFCILQLQE